jgi:hypothetical protein
MVKIQLDLSDEEDQIVEVFKLVKRAKTKQEAIKKMIAYFAVDIKPTKVEEKQYFK